MSIAFRRWGKSGLAVLVGTAVVAPLACATPTSVLVTVRTNVLFEPTRSIALSLPSGANPGGPIAAVTEPWSVPTGAVGTLTLVPRDAKDASIRIMAVMGVTRLAEECTAEQPEGCIFARRSLAFLPRTALNVPIALYAICTGKPCDADTTCNALGACVSAALDPSECATERGCSIEGDPDPSLPLGAGEIPRGVGRDGGSAADAGTDGSERRDAATDGATDVDSGNDAGSDAASDAGADGGGGSLGEAGVPCSSPGSTATCSTPAQKCCLTFLRAECHARSFVCSDDGFIFGKECDDDADCPGGRCCTGANGTACTTSCAIKMCSDASQCPAGMPTCATGQASPLAAYCQ